MTRSAFAALSAVIALLALAVVMLGAYVRLSDAGLGCPDWPGCYGRLVAPSTAQAIAEANASFPHREVETHKAWKEMIHRYLAGTLGLSILLLTTLAWRNRTRAGIPVVLPTLSLALVVFQALLGMWTVTHLVNPTIVTAHLLGGLATLALLWWTALRAWPALPVAPSTGLPLARLRGWAWGGLALVGAQILLGGWTSTNYAALACTEFPTCHGGLWWPETDFREGFTLWRELGVNYEFGVLDSTARTAVHIAHRLGALVVALYVGALAAATVVRSTHWSHRAAGLAIGAILLAQVGLGIGNILGQLPLANAVAHSGGAALLLLGLITLIQMLTPAIAEGFRGRPRSAAGKRLEGHA
jgi:cytochrome c oxidase assembly protein subunit 15